MLVSGSGTRSSRFGLDFQVMFRVKVPVLVVFSKCISKCIIAAVGDITKLINICGPLRQWRDLRGLLISLASVVYLSRRGTAPHTRLAFLIIVFLCFPRQMSKAA